MAQTSVEWLQQCMQVHLSHEQQMQLEGLFQQAKQMEKEQLLEFWIGGINSTEEGGKSFDQYYNGI